MSDIAGSATTHGVEHYDVLVIGSGFGGSVTALRLTEKGYRVGVLEAGRRFADDEFAKNTWDFKNWLFNPRLGMYGIQRVTSLKHVQVVSGAGVGGGSLVYGNTLYEPPASFYADPHWASITDWRDELAPCFDQAKRMLGVTTYDRVTESDKVMQRLVVDLGIPQAWHPTEVALVLGPEPGKDVGDPYFGGIGPARRTCLHCGECMTGCRHNAKNSLTKNYLYLAELAGTVVHQLTTVHDVRPRAGGGYTVESHRTGPTRRRGHRTFTADHVVFSAASIGTQQLLHDLRDRGRLPRLSRRLGELTRTNSEAGVTVRSRGPGPDYSQGAAITGSVHLDEHTHVEPCRYGKGSDTIALGAAMLTDPVAGRSRLLLTLIATWHNRSDLRRLYRPRDWSRQTVVMGVMQNHDNSLTTVTRRRRLGRGRQMTTTPGIGAPSPAHLPEANMVARKVAELIDGIPAAGITDALDKPISGHFLGGCRIGETPDTGVVDPYHRVHGHPGLHVIDGSTLCSNLGVNPSLTITAMAERATSMWPNAGDPDLRPPHGAAYRRVDPVSPRSPVVPAGAPAELRISAARHASTVSSTRPPATELEEPR